MTKIMDYLIVQTGWPYNTYKDEHCFHSDKLYNRKLTETVSCDPRDSCQHSNQQMGSLKLKQAIEHSHGSASLTTCNLENAGGVGNL